MLKKIFHVFIYCTEQINAKLHEVGGMRSRPFLSVFPSRCAPQALGGPQGGLQNSPTRRGSRWPPAAALPDHTAQTGQGPPPPCICPAAVGRGGCGAEIILCYPEASGGKQVPPTACSGGGPARGGPQATSAHWSSSRLGALSGRKLDFHAHSRNCSISTKRLEPQKTKAKLELAQPEGRP